MAGPRALNTLRTTASWPADAEAATSWVAASLAMPYGLTGLGQVVSDTGRPIAPGPYSAAEPMWTSRVRISDRAIVSKRPAVVSTFVRVNSAVVPPVAPVQFTR